MFVTFAVQQIQKQEPRPAQQKPETRTVKTELGSASSSSYVVTSIDMSHLSQTHLRNSKNAASPVLDGGDVSVSFL